MSLKETYYVPRIMKTLATQALHQATVVDAEGGNKA